MIITSIIMGGIVLIALIIAIAASLADAREKRFKMSERRLALEGEQTRALDTVRLKEVENEGKGLEIQREQLVLERAKINKEMYAR